MRGRYGVAVPYETAWPSSVIHRRSLAARASSAFAKNADASFRISFARFSSRFSRSSSFTRWRSSVVSPGRWCASRSAWRTQCRSVSAVQPIFSAIDSIAAHCNGVRLDAPRTSRTARSRTSGAYLFDGPLLGRTP